MDIDTDDDVLGILAQGESMDYEPWPGLLSRMIPRIEKIAHEEFTYPTLPQPPIVPSQPIPSSPPEAQSHPPSNADSLSQRSTTSTQSTNKENAPPLKVDIAPGTLPPQLLSLLRSTTTTLTSNFSTHPPHTIQRLAELVLTPKKHYKTLPSYLHALNRVVHVTSGAHVFPLPPAITDPKAVPILSNGVNTVPKPDPLSISWSNPTSALGSDESLGGALLTPIPWLSKSGTGTGGNSPTTTATLEGEVRRESTEMIEGPNGPGGIETVSVSVNGISSHRDPNSTSPISPSDGSSAESLRSEGGVTQGELLRQEQEASVVPATQVGKGEGGKGNEDGLGEQDEPPHARGPEEVGVEDMGPQRSGSTERLGLNVDRGTGVELKGINVEAAVGRRAEGREEVDDDVKEEQEEEEERPATPITPKRLGDELPVEGKRVKLEEAKDEAEGRSSGEIEVKDEKEPVKSEDQNVKMIDADGKTEDEKKIGEGGENVGPDAVDSSTL